jgi:hypothetical protein
MKNKFSFLTTRVRCNKWGITENHPSTFTDYNQFKNYIFISDHNYSIPQNWGNLQI